MGYEGFVFRKTESGARELATPAAHLSPKHRRCLILIDGAKTVADLAPMFRPNELAKLLSDLQAQGYIEADTASVIGPDDGLPELPQIDAATFLEVRRRASHEVSDRMGPAGDPLAGKIEGCESAAELRIVLREAEKIMVSFLGREYAQTFVKKIGKDLGG
jgi:hypothetical protein